MVSRGDRLFRTLTTSLIFLQIASAQLPKEIDSGPDGNIVITLGGVPDQMVFRHPPTMAFIRSKEKSNERTHSVPTHAVPKASIIDVDINENIELMETEDPDYDYGSYIKPLSSQSRPRKPLAAKSRRRNILRLLSEWIGNPKDGNPKAYGVNQKSVENDLPHGNFDARMGPDVNRVPSGDCRWTEIYPRRTDLIDENIPTNGTESIGSTEISWGVADAAIPLPLPECYNTQKKMICCNRVLEELIYRSSEAMVVANVHKCNTPRFSQFLRNAAERHFQTAFEIVVGNGDFASKVRFKDNLLCKTIVNDKYVLIYATPEPYPIDPKNAKNPL